MSGHSPTWRRVAAALVVAVVLLTTASCAGDDGDSDDRRAVRRPAPVAPRTTASTTATGPLDVYAADRPGMLSPVAARARSLVYVPNSLANTVDVIDPATYKIVDHFDVGALPQHVVPSWDLRTLYVANDMGNTLTPINPQTGSPGKTIRVDDPYNLYFTPDGTSAIVVAERLARLDFRDPNTFALKTSLRVPCKGVDHLDFSADEQSLVASCEFAGTLIRVRVDGGTPHVDGPPLVLGPGAKPQDVKLSPDGSSYYVADMVNGGVWIIDSASFTVVKFVPTGRGAHGLYMSRDSKSMFVSNRDAGTISVMDMATSAVRTTWLLPGHATPDMGGVSADGKTLWLSGRMSSEVYAINATTGKLRARIPVGKGPHGLCVWPQPGRFSLGHTGILR